LNFNLSKVVNPQEKRYKALS